MAAAIGVMFCGCSKDGEMSSDMVGRLNRQIDMKNKELASKDADISKTQAAKTLLEKEISNLKTKKELAAYEFVTKPMVEITIEPMEFVIVLKGTLKNTGTVQMNNVTLKVAFMDGSNSKILERRFQRDIPVPEMTNLSPYHVYYSDITDTLNEGESREFTMKIYFKNFQGSLDQLKPCVDAWNADGRRIQIGVLWGGYKEKE
jgi:hypothetical protein